jgi:hypothetical protein
VCVCVQERASSKSCKARGVGNDDRVGMGNGRPLQKKGVQKKATVGCPHLVAGGPNAEAWADEVVLQPMDVEVGLCVCMSMRVYVRVCVHVCVCRQSVSDCMCAKVCPGCGYVLYNSK